MAAKKKNATPPAKAGKTLKSAKTAHTVAQPARDSGQPKPSALDAAAKVLGETGQAMTCRELIEAMAAKAYWTSPAGRTPQATLYTAVTMLPKVAPSGATIKRARIDPVSDSDLLGLDLDAFHQADNDFTTCVPVGVVESIANLVSKSRPAPWLSAL